MPSVCMVFYPRLYLSRRHVVASWLLFGKLVRRFRIGVLLLRRALLLLAWVLQSPSMVCPATGLLVVDVESDEAEGYDSYISPEVDLGV